MAFYTYITIKYRKPYILLLIATFCFTIHDSQQSASVKHTKLKVEATLVSIVLLAMALKMSHWNQGLTFGVEAVG